MSLFDNIAFPLREHTKSETEVRSIVMEKIDLVGLAGAGTTPGEISGGMRKRAGLARALVLDPQIILCDEPDSGLDPVRTAYISQLLIDINAQIDATILIVTHNINIARTIPDNIGMLFRNGELVMFGPREVLLTSEQPVVAVLSVTVSVPSACRRRRTRQSPRPRPLCRPQASPVVAPRTTSARSSQVQPNPGMPERKASQRHRRNVEEIIHAACERPGGDPPQHGGRGQALAENRAQAARAGWRSAGSRCCGRRGQRSSGRDRQCRHGCVQHRGRGCRRGQLGDAV